MGQEAEDEEILEELKTEFPALETEIEEIRMTTLLSGEYDANNVILQLHSGAGGTEAQDWCQMLYRMYTRWAERHGYAWKTLDYEECDEAGIKSAVISIEGENAYGLLKSEHGVHRLVRVSPFDANARRQTSFAAVEVMPELPDDVEVEIRPEDIEMQVFRSSGAGGQHINKTSSAVRLIHKPTGIVVSSQQERSQFQNKDNCMKQLRAKLIELKIQQHAEKISDIKGVQMKIERIWLPHSIFICTPLRSLIFSACCCSFSSASLARSIFMALSRFWNWLRSVWQNTTMPVGRWVRRTAEEVLLMC